MSHSAGVDEQGTTADKGDEEKGATMAAVSLHPAPVKVPKSNRRGLLGRLTLVAEVEEPQDYSRRTKWYITFVVALAGVAAPLASSIILRRCWSVPGDEAVLTYRSCSGADLDRVAR